MVLKHILLLLVESFELVSYKIGRSYVYGGGGKYYVMLYFTFLINLDLKCETIFHDSKVPPFSQTLGDNESMKLNFLRVTDVREFYAF